ncbi:MAG: YkgJ family cysteine cluster protein [Desulfarculaceae bacterium]
MLPSSFDDRFARLGEDGFRFACHPEVPCFNQCCRKLNLVLTPYDVLRLRRNLGLSSEDFLNRHTEVKPGQNGWPQVWLMMNQDDPERTCPFLTESGCSVYLDRPGACRAYPLGRATRGGTGPQQEDFFLVKEDHCRGFEQGSNWTPETWSESQGLKEYNEVNDLFLPLITRQPPDSDPGIITKKMQMFFMACYNQDAFRAFVSQSRFGRLLAIPKARLHAAVDDDLELLRLGFDWLRFAIFGESVMEIRPQNGEIK